MNDLQHQISDRVNAFINEVTQLARKVAMETLASALGGSEPAAKSSVAAPRKAVPAAAPAAVAAVPAATRDAPAAGRRRGRKGQKRDPREIAKVQSDLAAYIAAHAGQRIEQIKAVFGVETKDLVLPIKKLVEAGTIRSEGTRRATKYFPVAAVSAAPAKGKVGRPKKK